MNKQRTIIASLALLCIILGSILMANFQEQRAGKLPYTIGSPVASLDPMMTGMMLKPFIVSADEPVPTVDFTIARDSMGDGWTLHATTTNFQFTPEHLNMAPAPGEGHLHLYIDNDLIVMLSPWQHIDALSPGPHVIKVSLNNNDHSIYTASGVQIETVKNIIVP